MQLLSRPLVLARVITTDVPVKQNCTVTATTTFRISVGVLYKLPAYLMKKKNHYQKRKPVEEQIFSGCLHMKRVFTSSFYSNEMVGDPVGKFHANIGRKAPKEESSFTEKVCLARRDV